MTWAIGRDTFAYLHGFHWDDHQWTRSIPEIDRLETFEQIVHTERPDLLRVGIGNVEQER